MSDELGVDPSEPAARGDVVSSRQETLVRIMDGALLALARQGVRKASMSDVTATAGSPAAGRTVTSATRKLVSGPLPTTSALKYSANQGQQSNVVPRLGERVEVVVKSNVSFAEDHRLAVQVIIAEPEFGTEFVRNVVHELVALAGELLHPARHARTEDGLPPLLGSGDRGPCNQLTTANHLWFRANGDSRCYAAAATWLGPPGSIGVDVGRQYGDSTSALEVLRAQPGTGPIAVDGRQFVIKHLTPS